MGVFSRAAAAALLAVGLAATGSAPVIAAEGDQVVINELLYNVEDADPAFAALEFIELANPGATAVDLGGYSFSSGITVGTADLKIAAGTMIDPGGFVTGSKDPVLYEEKYGTPPDFVYTGSLSNGGEQITLLSSDGAVADSLAYDDSDPWPVSPDGAGPSLELDSTLYDNALGVSWHASTVDYGTPRAANTPAPVSLTAITVEPRTPAPGQPTTVSVRAPLGATITMTSRVMFGAESSTPMLDDGASVGGAGDGVYSATHPGAAAGELVRFKIAAVLGEQSGSYPVAGDSRPYDGFVVADPELDQAQYPVLQWFIPDAVYTDWITNHRCDDVRTPATFAWNGQVLDGAMMEIKGHTTCFDAKAKWDVELPSGYTFDFGAPFEYPLDKFDLQNERFGVPRIGWEMVGASGEVTPKYQNMRVQRNGRFHGTFGVLENYDGTWRKAHGYGSAELYKVEDRGLRTYPTVAELAASLDIDKKNPDDGDLTALWELTQRLAQPASPSKAAWLRANVDLPQLANYTAVTVLMRHWDSGAKNFYVARNPDTQRWQILSWDMDDIMNAGIDTKGDFIYPSTTRNAMYRSLWELPDFRQMHFRRLRELIDQTYLDESVLARFDALTQPYAADIALDRARWGGRTLESKRERFIAAIAERRAQFAAHTNATEIPLSQSTDPQVVINEIQYHPATGSEFIELHNTSATESVDMSGWTIPAVGMTLPPGSVLTPGGYATVVSDDASFVADYAAWSVMLGQYSGDLADSGEEVSLLDGERVVDAVTYGVEDPWPALASGGGPSLELIDPTSDNADATAWATSTGTPVGGTPGAVNSVTAIAEPVTSTVLPYGSTWRYRASLTSPGTTWRAETFDDSTWSSGPASFGARGPQTTTLTVRPQQWTYYFRTRVTVPEGAPLQAVRLNLQRDDGAVVYVNGVEVARSNMPTGTISYTTRASSAVGTGTAMTAPSTLTIPASALRTGTNVIAVEVHQYYATASADVYFDAEMQITR